MTMFVINPSDHLFKLGRSYRITCHIEITQRDERVVNPILDEIPVSEEMFGRFPASHTVYQRRF